MRTRRVRVWLAVVAGMCAVVFGGTSAWAYWTSSASTNASVAADSLPQGATPTTAVSGATVTVTFAGSSTTSGHVGASGYLVKRYAVATGGTAVTLSCNASPCADTPGAGTWYYTDTPLLGANWQGAESARSDGQAVAFGPATKLAFTRQPSSPTSPNTAFAAQPEVAVQDSAGNTVTSVTDSVALALTTPNGATLSCAANPVNATAGVASFSGCKVNTAGTYTLTATATGLTSATSTQFTISAPAVSPTALVLANKSGGTAGMIESGDTITVTFSASLSVSSLCSAWSGDSSNKIDSTADILVSNPGTGAGNNVVSITAWSTCPTFHFGSIDLGSKAYVTSTGNSQKTIDFSGSTLAYDATAHTIKITLGSLNNPNGAGVGTVSGSTATLTIDPGLTGSAGQAISPSTFQTSNTKQF